MLIIGYTEIVMQIHVYNLRLILCGAECSLTSLENKSSWESRVSHLFAACLMSARHFNGVHLAINIL